MRKLAILIILCIIITPVFAIKECGRFQPIEDIPCNIITSYHPSGNCNDYNVSIFNSTGVNLQNITWSEYIPVCNATFNLSAAGVYLWNSSVENGIITVEADDNMISLSVVLFLLAINITVFVLPFFVRKFSDSKAVDYITRRLLWIVSLLLLWFNTTIIRTLASNQGMNIDDMLLMYWYIFTVGVACSILILIYFMVSGALKLIKEATMRKRMGMDDA